ncbi:MAG: PAS domain S-box protein [Gammaproteobacteria bacterium]|nr:PAS domain S-box protein [Gammaproteobacteria bacterium]
MNHINLKARILIPLFLIFTIFMVTVGISLLQEENEHIDKNVGLTASNIEQFYLGAFKDSAQKMMGIIEVLLDDPKLQQALKSADRAALLSLTSPLFERIKLKYSVTHFYFHDTQGVNLLRVHQPGRYGDTINRFTMQEARQSGNTAYGVELGPLGTFTLRVVMPVRAQGQILGYIELGEEVSPLIDNLASMFGVELVVLIDKSYLNKTAWEAGIRMLNRSTRWDDLKNSIIVSQTLPVKPETLERLLQQINAAPLSTIHPFMRDDINYRLTTHHLYDAGNRTVGKLIILSDMTARLHRNHMLTIYMASGIAVFAALLFGFFYWLLGRIEQQLNTAHQDLVESEASLNRSMQRIYLHYERTPLAVIEWNSNFEVSEWNPAAERIFGYSKKEALGHHAYDLIVPDTCRKDIDQVWKNLLEKNVVLHQVNENITKNGQIRICEWYNTPLVDENGNIIGVASLVDNITDQKKAEQQLQQRENELSQILQNMVDGVISIDANSTVLTFNHAAENLFGYTADEIIGKNLEILMPPPARSKHSESLKHYLQTGESHIVGHAAEMTALKKDGTTFPMRLSVAELPADEHGQRRFIGSCADISQQKKQEEQLRRAQKMDALGKLTGGIAHDFNNLLGIIQGYTELLQLQLKDTPSLQQYAQEIDNATERGSKLTRNLLSFARRKETAAEHLDINKVLQDNQSMLAKTLTARIELKLDLCNELWTVLLDKNDLENTIINLSINAMHAMPDGGSLTIKTQNKTLSNFDAPPLGLKPGHYIQLSLTDTGIGMDKEIQAKIFDPFFSTKAEQGTGLGLSQAYGFVQQAGGSIQIYSEPGKGSRFCLYFPQHEADGTNTHPKASEEIDHETLKGHETILIVDDEPALCKINQQVLESQGYTIFTARNGEEALAILEQQPIDLVFSDVIMPGMDGYQLANKIREKYPQIKIQLASGFNDQSHDSLADKQLHKHLLQKPVRSNDLMQQVRKLLDES